MGARRGPAPLLEIATAEWNVRQAEVLQRLTQLQNRFQATFAQAEASIDLLGYSGSYELRHHILAALGDLHRGVAALQATTRDDGFF